MFSNIKAYRVQEVITTGSANIIGNIKYSDLNDPAGKPIVSTKGCDTAKPLFYNFSQYPAVNEIVYIIAGPRGDYNNNGGVQHYYFPPININNSANHNALVSERTTEENEKGAETSLDNFKEKNIRPLLPYKGDVMIEGRYGNSIRFGSTIVEKDTEETRFTNYWSNEGKLGDPITIIRNGQTKDLSKQSFEHIIEDVNTDDSSIYLCSNQQITNFQKSGVYPKHYPPSYKHML